ncbi:MAG TPA: FG-GAP repeat protein, partial [Kofleriaceae bacterium]
MSYVGILEPTPSGSALGLIDQFDDPQSAIDWGDGFGAAMAVADFDHDGDDELVVGAPGVNVGAPGHVYVYRSAAGTGMELWGSRAMPAATCTDTTICWFGNAVGVGYFHTKTPPLGDFDMVVGAPYANRVFYYQADGNGTIPSYIESYGPH